MTRHHNVHHSLTVHFGSIAQTQTTQLAKMKFIIAFAALISVAAAVPAILHAPAAVTYHTQHRSIIPVKTITHTTAHTAHIAHAAPLVHAAPLMHAAPLIHGAPLAHGLGHGAILGHGLAHGAPLAHGAILGHGAVLGHGLHGGLHGGLLH